MKGRTAVRIARRGGLRQRYWGLRGHLDRLARLRGGPARGFGRVLARDWLRFALGVVRPVSGQTRERARAAAAWLLRAQAATPDDGVSLGYFPCAPESTGGWLDSYPETTGYIIPTLLDLAERTGSDEMRERALRMARWEIEVQMPSGAVQGGTVCRPDRQTAAVFNTGMVLQGYTAAYRASGEARFLDAGRRAADFLVGDMDGDGHFRSHGAFVSPGRIKTYNCLCAWALWRFAEDTGDDRYGKAAVSAVEAAVGQQQGNGWFANNCLTDPEAPLTHTIGYTLQGILEVGRRSGRGDLVEAARRGVTPLVSRIHRNGYLAGCFFPDWEPAVVSSCLTGSAQIAVVCYRLHGVTGAPEHRAAADRLMGFLKAVQAVDAPDPGVNGAIGGSFPLLGSYMTAGYPNWATKYFLDGLLLEEDASTGRTGSAGAASGRPTAPGRP
jgi:hypothetical protein